MKKYNPHLSDLENRSWIFRSPRSVILLCNLFIIRMPVIRNFISLISTITAAFVYLITRRVYPAGKRRLYFRIAYFLKVKKIPEICCSQKGIYAENKCIDHITYPVMALLPRQGIILRGNADTLLKIFRSFTKDPLSREYGRSRLWALICVSAYVIANIIILLTISGSYNLYYVLSRRMQLTSDIIWYVTNIFFLIQIVLFHKLNITATAFRFVYSQKIKESGVPEPVKKIMPRVTILLPSYREEEQLVRKSLVSHILQEYGNKEIVLLLDNDPGTPYPHEQENTKKISAMINTLSCEFRKNDKLVRETLKSVDPEGCTDSRAFSRHITPLIDCYLVIRKWIAEQERIIADSGVSHPFDSFFYEEVMQNRIKRIDTILSKLSRIIKRGETGESVSLEKDEEHLVVSAYSETSTFFRIPITLFMRRRYKNLPREKTKSANLRSYANLINKDISFYCDEKGDEYVRIDGPGTGIKTRYVATFDSDVIVTPHYLTRKISFLEDPSNKEYGLIQSPYSVPAGEGSAAGDASGVHTDWFFPYTLGLNHYESSFWLGFNGVFRYDAIKEDNFFEADTAVEDIEISLKLRKAGYNIILVPEEECITYSPGDLASLKVQRQRWASGPLRIAFVFIRDLIQKSYKNLSFREIFLRMLYILNLNLLPLFSTILYFAAVSTEKEVSLLLIIPWFVYVLTVFTQKRIRGRRKVGQIIDSIFIYFFLNSFHLRGFFQSVKNLFTKEKLFMKTPKGIAGKHANSASLVQLGYFEIVQILGLFSFYGWFIYTKFTIDTILPCLFPAYYCIIIAGAVIRFVGFEEFIELLFYRFMKAPFIFISGLFRR
ncbi:MAG: glycosyltransferase [Spirochaetales bacterium]|nr:glycosyltransferase [Spirochaetales bacterium]